jgi:hypothetical protein
VNDISKTCNNHNCIHFICLCNDACKNEIDDFHNNSFDNLFYPNFAIIGCFLNMIFILVYATVCKIRTDKLLQATYNNVTNNNT